MALIQVLIMTAIMSLIVLQFTQTAREQVSTAQAFQNRIKAELLLKTAKSRLLFTLFKYDPVDISDKTINGVKWNFRGQAFVPSPGVVIKIQAVSGLLSVLTTPDKYWQKTLLFLGVEADKVSSIIDSIHDWVDTDNIPRIDGAEQSQYGGKVFGPRNGPLQHISELMNIKGITADLYEQLKPLVTIYTLATFNPALAPHKLIHAIFSTDIAEQIINAQNAGNFTEQTWSSIVGSREYDFVDIHPRSTFKVSISVNLGEVILTDRFDIKVQTQKARDPLTILANY